MIDADGSVTQHGDLLATRFVHCRGMNGVSIAIEVINPYEPDHMPDGGPWHEVIDARWAHGRRYVLPTLEQCRSLVTLIEWLVVLGMPDEWPGIIDGEFCLREIKGKHERRGIWSHQQVGDHSDGSFPLLVAYLSRTMGVDAAYSHAVELAQTGREVAV
jgi:hypothetical protein